MKESFPEVLEKLQGDPCGKHHEEVPPEQVIDCVANCPRNNFNYLCAHPTFSRRRINFWDVLNDACLRLLNNDEKGEAQRALRSSRDLIVLLDRMKGDFERGEEALFSSNSFDYLFSCISDDLFLEIKNRIICFIRAKNFTRDSVDLIIHQGELAVMSVIEPIRILLVERQRQQVSVRVDEAIAS